MPKRTVSQSIDQKLYDYTHDLLEQRSEEKRASGAEPMAALESARNIRVSEIIEFAQSRDFQLRRMKRAMLERATEGVLKIVIDEEKDYFKGEVESENDDQDDDNMMVVNDQNTLNKSVVALWKNDDPRPNEDPVANDESLQKNASNHLHPSVIDKSRDTARESSVTRDEDSREKRTGSPSRATKRRKTKVDRTPPQTGFSALGGLDVVTAQLMELVGLPILHPEIYLATGVEPSRGVLLYGPPGCGKTTIANALAGELQVPFISISAPSVVSGMSGESEKKLREIFDEARLIAPCIIFVDEIDAITPKRDGGAQREMERRIVAQMLTLMDELTLEKTDGKPVVVMGATNRPDSLDPALRRAGRFDREICLNVPDEAQRTAILRRMTAGLKLEPHMDFAVLGKMTPGYVGADLKSLVTAAGIAAMKRMLKDINGEGEEKIEEVNSKSEKSSDSEKTPEEGGEPYTSPSRENLHIRENIRDETPSTATPGYIDEIQEDVEMEVDAVHTESSSMIDEMQEQFQEKEKERRQKDKESFKKPNSQKDEKSEKASTLKVESKPTANEVTKKVLTTPVTKSTIETFLQNHPHPLTSEQLEPLCITYEDFLTALPTVQPTAKREGFATVPDVLWANVGALNHIRMELHMCIVQPIRKPELYLKVGISAPGGVLMWGPPGCGKTLLAKAVANESRANFISIKGPELLNKYVGESERAVRQVFQRARASVPCIIFFDELDALVPRRDALLTESSLRVVNTLLTELDGLNDRKGVFVIGATNRPDMIDPAMLRPGRLDKTLYIELPSAEERYEILTTLVKANHTPVASDVDLRAVANHDKCRNFSGADLSSLVREAAVLALKKKFFHGHQIRELDASGYYEGDDDDDVVVTNEDFAGALHSIKPSVSDRDRARYEKLNKRMGWTVIEEKGEE